MLVYQRVPHLTYDMYIHSQSTQHNKIFMTSSAICLISANGTNDIPNVFEPDPSRNVLWMVGYGRFGFGSVFG